MASKKTPRGQSSSKTKKSVQSISDPSAMETGNEDQYITSVLSHLPKKKTLHQFAKLFLRAFSFRVLQNFSHKELAEFVQERFRFFNEVLPEGGGFRIYNPKLSNKTLLEFVFPDAAFLLITIDNLLREFGIRVTFKLHILLSMETDDKGIPSSFIAPSPESERIVMVYIEFEEYTDEKLLNNLHAKVEKHLNAVQIAHRDHDEIINKLVSLKKNIASSAMTPPEPKEEWVDLLDWLMNQNFSISGYIQLPLSGMENKKLLRPTAGSGLGIFSQEYLTKYETNILENLIADVWHKRNAVSPFRLDTVKVKSPVQRFENLMCLSLKIPNKKGLPEQHMFLGLIRQSSLQAKKSEVPVIRYKMEYIYQKKNMLENSFYYNEVARIFTDIPHFELFRTSADSLLQMVENLLSITNPYDIYCFAQSDLENKKLQLIIALPPSIFSHKNIQIIVDYLKIQAPYSDYEIIEVSGWHTSRLHVYFDLLGDGSWVPDIPVLEDEIGEMINSWEEKVRQIMYEEYPSSLSDKLSAFYLPLMPPHYRIRNTPEDTVRDIMILEKLAHGNDIQINLSPFSVPGSDLAGKVSVVHLYTRPKLDLIHVMPVLQNMGFYVVDQLTARMGNSEHTFGYIHTYRVQDQKGQLIDIQRHKLRVQDLLIAVVEKRTEDDPLNALAILGDMDWRAINVLQLYRNLYLQLGRMHTRTKINTALQAHPNHAKNLFEYFKSKFSPADQFGDVEYRKTVLLPQKKQEFLDSLRSVDEVADDMILRRLFNLIENTLRTNFYIPKPPSDTFISIKLESRKVEQMPVPVPFREIYVHDVGMEGTHLRFGPVARGGLRWSDRLDDFRTEILGLVKTQQTKNVVIVPVGSKGGFIVKKQSATREEAAAESKKQYRKLISGLLDITDNLDANRQARHPAHIIPYDGLDPYLVVAADKGTATFSDTANSISAQYQFWLDDGFASGGSVGYDHKKEGITARGAWECVKLHFKELGKDIQTEPTTAIGIGDMNGDVFGNGMLLSEAIKLQGAFNHMHIFLDPDPDPAISWKERQRLFQLPSSTWKDYNAKLMSAGGGIYERKAKEISLSPQVKKMLGVEKDILNGEEVIQAILRMEVELIWLGGIGTYMKSDNETHFDVGDQANDSVRINISECNATVIGEGANLGLTQLGRIAFDQKGHLNTDAIDNSAGVNMSDYEVNIKILLQQLLLQKHLKSIEERNEILEKATDEVSELVLANNRGQHRLLSMDQIRSAEKFRLFKYLIRYLIVEKGLDAQSESIPSRGELEKMEKASERMSRPVLAVLQAYVKMSIYNELLASELPSDPYLETTYQAYFPETICNRFGNKISGHPLKREIIGTLLTNKIVNQAGMTFFFRMEQLTNRATADIAKAYLIFDEILSGSKYREKILSAKEVQEKEKYQILIKFEEVMQVLTQSLLQLGKPLDFSMIEKYKGLLDTLKKALVASEKNNCAIVDTMEELGFTKELAKEISIFDQLAMAPDIIYLHESEGIEVPTALRLTTLVDEIFGFQWLRDKIQNIELKTDWDQSHQDILAQTIGLRKINLIRLLLQHHDKASLGSISSEELLASLSKQFAIPVAAHFQTLDQLKAGSPINLTTLSVSINRLNFLDMIQG
ncbi:MAG: NAD-glutamate dehydrogenase [SAR324 cluster bacterium]|nr:NAD-glutamate dehydrogenase [SAR324 cluster bacterium]